MSVSKKSMCVVQILETKLQLYPLERNLLSECDFLETAGDLTGTIILIGCCLRQPFFFLMQKKKAGKSALIVTPSHSDV